MSIETTYAEIVRNLPISINGFLGDALQPSQWPDTLAKLEELHKSGHGGHIMIPTKYVPSSEQERVLAEHFPNVWIWMAITGLNESRLFSLGEYRDAYYRLCSRMARIVCAIRPIVPGQNDSMAVLRPIIDMVAKGNRMLTYEGYRDPMTLGSKKYRNEALFSEIDNDCREKGITVRQKCVCLVAAVTNSICYHCHPQPPRNQELLRAFGYQYEVEDNRVVNLRYGASQQATKGDVAFANIVTGARVGAESMLATEVLSLQLPGRKKLVSTSSWFSWARQVPCVVGCGYCFADYKSLVRTEPAVFGCNPQELLTLLA